MWSFPCSLQLYSIMSASPLQIQVSSPVLPFRDSAGFGLALTCFWLCLNPRGLLILFAVLLSVCTPTLEATIMCSPLGCLLRFLSLSSFTAYASLGSYSPGKPVSREKDLSATCWAGGPGVEAPQKTSIPRLPFCVCAQ